MGNNHHSLQVFFWIISTTTCYTWLSASTCELTNSQQKLKEAIVQTSSASLGLLHSGKEKKTQGRKRNSSVKPNVFKVTISEVKKALSYRNNPKSHWATTKQALSRQKSLEIADKAGKNWNRLVLLVSSRLCTKIGELEASQATRTCSYHIKKCRRVWFCLHK